MAGVWFSSLIRTWPWPLDRLMEPVGPLPANHEAAGELVDDHDLAVLDDIVAVVAVEVVGLGRVVDQVGPLHVARRVEALDACDRSASRTPSSLRWAVQPLLLDLEVGHGAEQAADPVGLGVLADVVEGESGDDRGPRLVDEDQVDLVDDRVVERALRCKSFEGFILSRR